MFLLSINCELKDQIEGGFFGEEFEFFLTKRGGVLVLFSSVRERDRATCCCRLKTGLKERESDVLLSVLCLFGCFDSIRVGLGVFGCFSSSPVTVFILSGEMEVTQGLI